MNEDKTHLCEIPRERFDFLGYTFGRCYSCKDGPCLHRHSSIEEEYQADGGEHQRGYGSPHGLLDAEEIVGRLNRKLRGWANYFCLGPVSPAYRRSTTTLATATSMVVQETQGGEQGDNALPRPVLHEELGLVRSGAAHARPSVGESMSGLSESRMRK